MSDLAPSAPHILIVDDEPDFAALLRLSLMKAGYRVTAVHNCDDALAFVRGARPDLITLDIHMPRQSGALFYRTVKTDQASRDIPVVIVTGLTRDDKEMEDTIRRFLEPGHIPPPDAYLEKPVDESLLITTLKEILPTSARAVR